MKTGQFIDLLSADVQPVRRGTVGRTLALALVIGGGAALGLMLVTVGLRPDLFEGASSMLLAVKLLFTVSLAGIGSLFLVAASCPGRNAQAIGIHNLTVPGDRFPRSRRYPACHADGPP